MHLVVVKMQKLDGQQKMKNQKCFTNGYSGYRRTLIVVLVLCRETPVAIAKGIGWKKSAQD